MACSARGYWQRCWPVSCDADWGKRLADGLAAARAGQAAEGGNQYNEAKGSKAAAEAEAVAHDAKPY